MILTAAPLPPATADLLALLDAWVARGWLRALDAAFARLLASEAPDAPPLLLLAAALASHQLGRGHACLALRDVLDDPAQALSLPPEGQDPTADDIAPATPQALLQRLALADWLDQLNHPTLVGHGPGHTPLVRVADRLYLRRYWHYEQQVRHALTQRLATPAVDAADSAAWRPWLDTLFPPDPSAPAPDWQKIACALAARGQFTIVTGGPGTGKTTTVVRLLALLQLHALRHTGQALRIRLAAPTGKAAARLSGAIASAVARLPLATLSSDPRLPAGIPTQVGTLHRLLGPLPDSRHFRHHAGHPLPLDVLVVDEASMVDLELMHATLDALPPHARLVLLGDKDQLASVDAGAVLGQLCQGAEAGRYTPASAEWIARTTGEAVPPTLIDPAGPALAQHTVMLRHSRRFGPDSGIGRLAAAVNHGHATATRQVLEPASPDLLRLAVATPEAAALRDLLVAGYRPYLERLRAAPPVDAPSADLDHWAAEVLRCHTRFQVLCALRQGPWGVAGLNERTGAWLHQAGLIEAPHGWFVGRPVLVTRNDTALGLMNGDIGVVLPVPGAHGPVRRIAFPRHDGQPGVRWVLPSRLTAADTVFALTVHKSQGSEFEHVALVLPDRPSPVLTRELLYTGITRAQRRFTLVEPGAASVWQAAVALRTRRAGGLVDDGASEGAAP